MLSYGMLSAFSRTAGLLLLPILTRALSVDEYGVVDLLALTVSLVTSALRMGLPSALTRYIGDSLDAQDRNRLFSTLLFFTSLVALLVTEILLFASEPFATSLLSRVDGAILVFYACWIAFATVLTALPMMLLRLQRRILGYSSIEIAELLVYVALTVVLVTMFDWGIEGVFLAQLLSRFSGLGISLILIRDNLNFSFDLPLLSKSLRYSVPMVPMIVVSQLVNQVNRFILLALVGLAGVGVFGAAARLCGLYEFFLLVFKQSWQPLSLSFLNASDRDDIYRRLLNYFIGFASAGALLFVAVSPELFRWVLVPEYYDGAYLVPGLLGAAVLHHVGAITGIGLLVAERTSKLLMVSVIMLLISVAMTWWLVSNFGLLATAYGAFLAETVYVGLVWRLTLRYSTIRFDIKKVVVIFVTYILASPGLILLGQMGAYGILGRVILVVIAITIILKSTIDRQAVDFLSGLIKSCTHER